MAVDYFLHFGQTVKKLTNNARPDSPTRMYTTRVSAPSPKIELTRLVPVAPIRPQLSAPMMARTPTTLHTGQACLSIMASLAGNTSSTYGIFFIVTLMIAPLKGKDDYL